MKTKDDGIQDAGLAGTAGILRPQRTVPQNDSPQRELLQPKCGQLATVTKSIMAAAVSKTRGTKLECL